LLLSEVVVLWFNVLYGLQLLIQELQPVCEWPGGSGIVSRVFGVGCEMDGRVVGLKGNRLKLAVTASKAETRLDKDFHMTPTTNTWKDY
jgi:hypothetical protein